MSRLLDFLGEHAFAPVAVLLVLFGAVCVGDAILRDDCKRACGGAPSTYVDDVGCLCNTAHETWTWRALP